MTEHHSLFYYFCAQQKWSSAKVRLTSFNHLASQAQLYRLMLLHRTNKLSSFHSKTSVLNSFEMAKLYEVLKKKFPLQSK